MLGYGGWSRCKECDQVVFRDKLHECPEIVTEQREQAISVEAAVEMGLFDEELFKWLDTPEAKFYVWLAENEKHD